MKAYDSYRISINLGLMKMSGRDHFPGYRLPLVSVQFLTHGEWAILLYVHHYCFSISIPKLPKPVMRFKAEPTDNSGDLIAKSIYDPSVEVDCLLPVSTLFCRQEMVQH